ncbi:hypothetical protein VCRA2126O85_110100 [Vibrio crassostreae]|nr:hypothetical protein VCRA2128O100_100100 [Vibrio crassostreae]CAK2573310.1 hypothetical protein VCRA2126O86_100100 [Vibrio crassostreae]CAK2584670.1 hypothetical protein VCRA2125O83_110050 [Vibrio crassostreae]CAK2589755.1 hypothetical protein VCRA2128O106_110099 [Vibrio crassostreae]CAK2590398.1 hypothetical protein VCRA2126O85_110100 [Vibrio crassostreae]
MTDILKLPVFAIFNMYTSASKRYPCHKIGLRSVDFAFKNLITMT